jgi:hypothetical protein
MHLFRLIKKTFLLADNHKKIIIIWHILNFSPKIHFWPRLATPRVRIRLRQPQAKEARVRGYYATSPAAEE